MTSSETQSLDDKINNDLLAEILIKAGKIDPLNKEALVATIKSQIAARGREAVVKEIYQSADQVLGFPK